MQPLEVYASTSFNALMFFFLLLFFFTKNMLIYAFILCLKEIQIEPTLYIEKLELLQKDLITLYEKAITIKDSLG